MNQNILQKEYLYSLQEDIQKGIVKFEDDEQYFDNLQSKFPVVGNGIAWNKVANHLFFDLERLKDDQILYSKVLEESWLAIMQALRELEIDEMQEVIIIGDNVLDVALRIPVGKINALYKAIFDLPQHTYILPEDASWCINYTFEDRLFFGLAPN